MLHLIFYQLHPEHVEILNVLYTNIPLLHPKFGFHFSQSLNIRYKRFDISELKTRCDTSELSKEKNIKIVPQVFILVPDNGLCHSTITDCDPKITEIGHLDPVLRNRAGVINRPYKNTIYRVEGPGGKVCGSSF